MLKKVITKRKCETNGTVWRRAMMTRWPRWPGQPIPTKTKTRVQSTLNAAGDDVQDGDDDVHLDVHLDVDAVDAVDAVDEGDAAGVGDTIRRDDSMDWPSRKDVDVIESMRPTKEK